MVMQDPPVHTEFRKLVSRGFTPRQVEAVEPKVREFVRRAHRAAARQRRRRHRRRTVQAAAVAWSSPTTSGCPRRTATQFDGWTDAIVAANTADGGIGGALETLGDALGGMMAYFTALIERRRRRARRTTRSRTWWRLGSAPTATSRALLSILAFTFTMVTGGNDTTTGMLGGAVQLLHQRPDQRRLLAENPELIRDSVDEFLRLTSPVQVLGRTVTRDVTIGDTTIPEGRRVMFLYGSGNRDERQYGPDAGELDVTRKPRNILTFSHGAHHCLGAAAARMQSRVALTNCWPASPISRSTRPASSGPVAVTCGGRCRCPFTVTT